VFDELLHLKPEAIAKLAASADPFDLPTFSGNASASTQATADWQEAAAELVTEAATRNGRKVNVVATLNRATLDFIRESATTGNRHRLLFSAAANLAEFGCTPSLAHALLDEPGRDSGLSPSDVRRQVECGLHASTAEVTPAAAPGIATAAQSDSIVQSGKECVTSDSVGFGGILPAVDSSDTKGGVG